jgi:hypothetical protein
MRSTGMARIKLLLLALAAFISPDVSRADTRKMWRLALFTTKFCQADVMFVNVIHRRMIS